MLEPLQDPRASIQDDNTCIHFQNDYKDCNNTIHMEDYIEDYRDSIQNDNMLLEWIQEDIFTTYRSVGIQTPDHLFERKDERGINFENVPQGGHKAGLQHVFIDPPILTGYFT